MNLSQEQNKFIQTALQGQNILVDACIGSGKTTAIQALCNQMPKNKRILYLTYNKLLKLDAKSRIFGTNVYVSNYHGFGYIELLNAGIRTGVSDIIQTYNKIKPPCNRFDVLILDEYQDIEQETSEMLRHIKNQNPGIQIIAVGDMAQKIYDKTVLDADVFIDRLLDQYVRMEFTLCFRLSAKWAAVLGDIWQKNIVGVNPNCQIQTMSYDEAFHFIKMRNPNEILCLGANHGKRSEMLNDLEQAYPGKFNKNTVWSKVSEHDSGATQPTPNCAIFTTFDGCKGMERDVCVVFDWTEQYWFSRTNKPNAKYEILRNIFCVAASRGKSQIIFVEPYKGNLLHKSMLMEEFDTRTDFDDMDVSGMFDYKYAEDVEAAYEKLQVKEVQPAENPIDLPIRDGMIDLSMCIGLCMKAEYFTEFNIDYAIDAFFNSHKDLEFKRIKNMTNWSIEQKVLYLTMLVTNQNRYWTQVSVRFMTPEKRAEIQARLQKVLPNDAKAQVETVIDTAKFKMIGYLDIMHNDSIYQLYFCQEIQHSHLLQAAVHGIVHKAKNVYVWNLYNNQMFSVEVPNKPAFLTQLIRTITKGSMRTFPNMNKILGISNESLISEFVRNNQAVCDEFVDFVTDYIQKAKTPPPTPKVYAFFKNRGVKLPVNTKQFCKLFAPILKEKSEAKSKPEEN